MDKQTYKQLKLYKSLSAVTSVSTLVLAGYILFSPQPEVQEAQTQQIPFGSPPGDRQFSPDGMPGGFRGMMDPASFFDSETGELDTTQLDEMAQRFGGALPEMFVERMQMDMQSAVSNGTITQNQADALLQAIEEYQ